MKLLSNTLKFTLPLIALSFINPVKTLAEIPTNSRNSQQIFPQLIAQAESKEVEITINPPVTPEQQAKIKAIETQYEPKINAAIEKYKLSAQELSNIIGTNPPTSDLKTKRKQVLDDERAVEDLIFERLMDIRDVLTPEQKQSISDSIRKSLKK